MNIHTNKLYDDAMWTRKLKEMQDFPNRPEENKLRKEIDIKINDMTLYQLRRLKEHLEGK